ncbi:MAG TPA: hypothetical protein VHA33_13885 [Candidatus Angelobacter sp.]|jgi:hypothetical protein|nr:hypothetical protein [Candidatus Angelobacter sp.]
MRRTAMLVLLALLAVAVAFAQNPTNANPNSPTNQQSGGATSTAPSVNQNTQTPSGQPANNQMPGQTTQPSGQSTQLPNNQNAPQGTNPNTSQFPSQSNDQNAGQNTMPSGATNQGGENQSVPAYSGTPQENSKPNSGFGARQVVPSGAPVQVPAGTEIHATLDTPLSTKTSKPGDRFTATVAQPIRGSNGSVIPAGSHIEGEVSEAEQGKAVAVLRGKGKLNLRFRDLILPNGQMLPLTATLVSVHSTNGKDSKNADQEGQVESGTRGRDVAKDVGIGAGIGTIAGLIFGGPLKGLAIGAMAGGGYVLATKGKEVNLPAETGMVLKLDQPLVVNGSSLQR